MTSSTRLTDILQAFAKLADTLVADFEVVDLLQTLCDTCRDALDASEVGILLLDGGGGLEVIASTNESSRLVEAMELSAEAGPCIETFRTGRVVSVPDISSVPDEWAAFRGAALELGFHSTHAVPMRLRDTTIGTLNLLRNAPGSLNDDDAVAAQALADVATIGILQERAAREERVVREQLQTALNSRVVIEQAKGVVAHTNGVDVDAAFQLIRQHARSHQVSIMTVASAVVNRSLTL